MKGGDTSLFTQYSSLIKKHLMPVPRIEIGRKLARSGCVTAMIDVSDGLSSDLGHICAQSNVGAEIQAEKVPLSKDILKARSRLKTLPLHYALSGGEDYELLFTVPARKRKKFRSLRIPAKEIGIITRSKGMVIRDGMTAQRIIPSGYDHFREE